MDLTTLSTRRLRRFLGTGIAMIFQDPMSSMNPAARVGAQLIDGARTHRSLSRAEARVEAVDGSTKCKLATASELFVATRTSSREVCSSGS